MGELVDSGEKEQWLKLKKEDERDVEATTVFTVLHSHDLINAYEYSCQQSYIECMAKKTKNVKG